MRSHKKFQILKNVIKKTKLIYSSLWFFFMLTYFLFSMIDDYYVCVCALV